jgi:hypothetical protein
MKLQQINDFRQTKYLKAGHGELLEGVRPAFERLFSDLIALPDSADRNEKLSVISKCFESINEFENDIETVERESILDAIYSVGSIIGLDATTEYAEQFRGDW